MALRRLQEVTNDPTSPVLTIDDTNGVIAKDGTAINSGGTVTSVAGRTGAITVGEADVTNLVSDLALKAPKASPTFTGTVKIPNATTHEIIYSLDSAGSLLGDADLKFDPTIDELSGPALVIKPGQFAVAALPAGSEGQIAYATNGRKVGEGGGAGTGVPVYFSNAQWRVFSTDAQVAA